MKRKEEEGISEHRNPKIPINLAHWPQVVLRAGGLHLDRPRPATPLRHTLLPLQVQNLEANSILVGNWKILSKNLQASLKNVLRRPKN